MSKSYRIRTTPGQENNGYVKVNVDLNQNYDHLELLSLKISQKDDYRSFCSEYGVVAGRVIVNNGFGVPNVKVSIFVPVEDSDLEDPVISAIYPYTDPFPDKKNQNGIRYNVLPKNQQSFDHTPVGTLPKKREVLDDNTVLEIYEKYYKYTTTTNSAGDYILFGVPVGDHFLHYDMDISDIGFISVRPFELIDENGYSEDLFKDRFKYKSSNNLDSLPQIFSENIPITVEPYWCDSLSVGSPLGINRFDIEPNIEITPTAIFMGSVFTDDEKDSLNKNCKPSREMGKMDEVITGSGKIEAIRRTVDGNIETFSFNDNAIDDNGNWSVLVPMNVRKVVTDEFGNLVPSPDGVKGIATEGDYRFRISMDATSTDKRLRERAKYLVPNTNNNFNFGEYSEKDLKNSQFFTINEQLSTITDGTPYEDDITNQYNYLEEFFPFRWKKVYTVKQYIGRMQKTPDFSIGGKTIYADEARGFIGIKDIINAPGVNKFPTSRTDTNIHPLYVIICILVVIFGHLVGFINGIIQFINGLVTLICDVKIPTGICGYSLKGGTFKLPYRRQEFDGNNYVNNTFIAGPRTNVCYDAKGICDDVQNLSSCGGDLKDCYRDSWVNVTQTSGYQESEFLRPFNEAYPAVGCQNISGWSQPIRSYITNWENFPAGNARCCMHYEAGWCYNYAACKPANNPTSTACRRVALLANNDFRDEISACDRCDLNPNPYCTVDNPEQNNGCCEGEFKLLGSCWNLKYKCLFGGLICKNCKDPCGDEDFSCCSDDAPDCPNNDSQCGSGGSCCGDRCCAKIGLIPLKCADEGKEYNISLLKTPFSRTCNATYVKPFTCINCGGRNTKGIKDWASCILEPVAVFLRMLKFDFYNDWVGGSLYFPLVKRKYKLKKNKRKFGQIKKDKFCDYDCYLRTGLEINEFGLPVPSLAQINQPNPTYQQHRIRIPVQTPLFPIIEVEGCAARVRLKRSTNWYGTPENDTQTYNLDLAVKEFEFVGKNNDNEKCAITFDTFAQFQNTMNSAGINVETPNREVEGEHGKPTYVEVDDNWVNIGGHGHHRNICDDTRMLERREFFKTSLDCLSACNFCADNPLCDDSDEGLFGNIGGDDCPECDECEPNSWGVNGCNQGECATDDDPAVEPCDILSCLPDCGSNGVAPCIDTDINEPYENYSNWVIKHGLISWNEGEIYYTPYIPKGDAYDNDIEYKGNLMLPTTIQELGSSVYCDIDDIPFIMDSLPPTTFNASYEEIKYRFGDTNNSYSGPNGVSGDEDDGVLRQITKFDDKKNMSINLRAYVEFACSRVVCTNITAPVVQSQVGVEIIDKNDIGIEIGNCFLRFDHDDELRNYFCRRFNGYKAQDLSFHHQRPGSIEFENEYNTYPEITLVDGYNSYYQLPTGEIILSEYNDSDSFIPGDGCGYVEYNSNGTPTGTYDYFYGVAPGQTSGFINYPNTDTSYSSNGTISFGNAQGPEGTDEIFDPNNPLIDDENNGSTEIKGVRFNRSQTPYYLYFGLVPGKTALHKTVGRFFADKIDAVTLEGLGSSSNSVNENINNTPNVTNNVENNFSVYKTCLGETLIEKVKPQ